MPPLPVVPKCLEVIMTYSDGGGARIINRIHFAYTGTVSSGDLSTLLASINSAWTTALAPHFHAGTRVLSISGNDLGSTSGAQAVNITGANGTNSTGPALTSGACAVLGEKTSLKYKGGHGRIYLPAGTTTDLTDNNTWSTTFTAALATAWQTFLNDIVVPAAIGTITQSVLHRYGLTATSPVVYKPQQRKSVPLTNPFTTPITSFSTNPQVGSQRRRNQQSG